MIHHLTFPSVLFYLFINFQMHVILGWYNHNNKKFGEIRRASIERYACTTTAVTVYKYHKIMFIQQQCTIIWRVARVRIIPSSYIDYIPWFHQNMRVYRKFCETYIVLSYKTVLFSINRRQIFYAGNIVKIDKYFIALHNSRKQYKFINNLFLKVHKY